MDILTKAIKSKTKMGVYEFIQKVLKTSYNAFFYRYRHGSIKLHEYILIMKHTGMTFEELFVNKGKIDLPPENNQQATQEPEPKEVIKDEDGDDLPYIDTFDGIDQKG